MKYYIITFGCKANISDSERIAGMLESLNHKKALNESSADILIYNTCSVRQSAEDRIFGLNKKLKNLKQKNAGLLAIITGCVLHYKENELKKRLPQIDGFFKIKDLERLPDIISNIKTRKKSIASKNIFLNTGRVKNAKVKTNKKTSALCEYFLIKPKYESPYRAFIPISSGCNNFCSYCVVPYSRGTEKTRPAKDIIAEAKYLIKNGCKEIWLLGQNVNSYKCKNKKYIGFPELLKTINSLPGKFWIRFSSPHPKDFSDKLIQTLAECEKFPRYINLPVQSGDNEILKKMKRNYSREEYIKLARKIKDAMPDIALSTDTIVGFPKETKKQFLNTVKLYKEINFDMAFISEYSARPGTLAAKLYKDEIPKKEKTERKNFLTETLSETALKKNKKLIGKIVKTLIDENKNRRFFGRTEGNKVIEIIGEKAKRAKIGQFAKIKVLSASPWKLQGEMAD